MKYDERRIGDLTKQIARYRVVLLHGDDPVLIADRARRLIASFASGSEKGVALFAPTELTAAEHARAPFELAAPMLGGGVALVRLREATDGAAVSVEAVLQRATAGLLLVEAGALTAKSKLRSIVERATSGAAVLCRASEARDMAAAVESAITRAGGSIDPAALRLLIERAQGFGQALHDVEKLTLLAGESATIAVSQVLALDQDFAGGAMEDLVFAAAAGLPVVDGLLERLLDDGTAPAAVVRSLLVHLTRVRSARVAVDDGGDIGSALAALRPPVFYHRIAAMRATIARWRLDDLDRACAAIWQADRACRSTGAPVDVIARRAVWDIAQQPVRA